MSWPVGVSYGSLTGFYGGGWTDSAGLPGGVAAQVGDSALSAAQFGGSDAAATGAASAGPGQ